MTFMVWSEELDTGVDIIDRQHRELVSMLNRAAPVLARSSLDSTQAVGPLLDGLVAYAATHFHTEEEMMVHAGMDVRARDHHHATHAGFAQQVVEMVGSFSQGRGVTGDSLLSFLGSWLVLHIMGEDQAMARQFRALHAGMSGQQAYAQARGGELHPTPAALSSALIGIYTMHTRENRELLLANDDLAASRAAIQHHSDNLEHLVGLRTAELEQAAASLRTARDAAEAASRAKTRFLGTMSHELRTPMNAVLGFSRLLHDQGLPAPQDVLARKIVEASERLLALLNGIIDYARLQGGDGGTLQPVVFELATVLAGASAPGFAVAREKGLATRLDVDPTLPAMLHGDPRIIQRVLGHLIDNAAKFTVAGSVRLSVTRVAAAADGRVGVRFDVGDSGIGMPPEILSRLFQPFMQADDGVDRKFEGIGLGLALARELARLSGGEVGCTSEPGKGSTFWLALELGVANAGAAPPGAPRPDSLPSLPERIGMPATANGPLPEDLRKTLQTLEDFLCACDTRAADVLTQAAPGLRPWLGARVDRLAGLIEAFDYDQAYLLLKSLQSDTTEGIT